MIKHFILLLMTLTSSVLSGNAQSITWPLSDAGIPNYNGNDAWGTTYNSANPIPGTFLTFVNHGAGTIGSEFLGLGAGGASNTPTLNTGLGDYALYYMTGPASQNVAVGHASAYALTTGVQNVAIGESSMLNNGTGSANTSVGYEAMGGCVTIPCMLGSYPISGENTAVGWKSMFLVTTGAQNTAVGENSMTQVTTGNYNTTVGADSQSENTTGTANTTFGHDAMTGSHPVVGSAASCAGGPFTGYTAYNNTTVGEGSYCTATTGYDNTIIGYQSGVGLQSGIANTYVGTYAGNISTMGLGNNNYDTFLGASTGFNFADQSYSNSTAIGYQAVVTASNQMVFGNSDVTQIVVPAGVSINSQDTGAPGITFSPNNVSISLGSVSGTLSAVVATVPSNTFSSESTQPLTAFYTTTTAGQYQLCAQLSVKTAGAGTGTFAAVMAYTSDGNVMDIVLGNAVPVAFQGSANIGISTNNVPSCITAYLDNATSVSSEILAEGRINEPPTMRYGFKVIYLGQ